MSTRFPLKDMRAPLPTRPAVAKPQPETEPSAAQSELDRMDAALADDLAPKPQLRQEPSAQEAIAPRSPTASELAARTAARTAARLDQVCAPASPAGAHVPVRSPSTPGVGLPLTASGVGVVQLERLLRTQESELRKRENDIQRLQDENHSLKRENRDMHRFLADYGLHWVGSSSSSTTPRGGSAASSKVASPPPSAPTPATAPAPAPATAAPPRAPPPAKLEGGKRRAAGPPHAQPTSAAEAPRRANIDMEVVRRVVSELNAMAEGGGGDIVRKRDGSHGFVTPSLNLTFWADGLQLDSGALRQYENKEAKAFLRDLLDGYFPYELKHAFPEGVVFTLSDCTDRQFASGLAVSHEWGSGRKLDSRGDTRGHGGTGPMGALTSAASTLAGVGSHAVPDAKEWQPAAALVDQGLLRRAPDAAPAAANSPAPAAGAGGQLDSEAQAATGAAGSGCRLQIKGEGGVVACVLDLAPTESLSAVHDALASQAVVPAGCSYELRTAFPAKVLGDRTMTLAALGLAPSATLCIRITSSR
jgi:hypothetical protein